MPEYRRAARLRTHVQALVERKGRGDAGTLVSLSRVGGFVEAEPDCIPPIGAKVRLVIAAQPAVDVEARVVSKLPNGFGVEFTGTSVDLLQLIDELGAA